MGGAGSQMKILQILPSLEMGGVERGTVEVARALKSAGIENAVASSGGPMVAELEAIGVPHFQLPVQSKNPFTVWRNIGRIAELARREKFTLLHVRSRAPAWSVYYASRRTGIPMLATYHGVYGTSPAWLKIPYNRIMTKGIKVIAVSDHVKRHIIETYGVPESKIVRIHRGADINLFRPSAETSARAAALKAQLGFAASLPVVTLPGRLTRWKGQTVLLQALQQMRNQTLGVLFVGSDQGRSEYTAELKALAAKLPPSVQVVFLSRSDDMPAVYALSAVVANCSTDPEAFGRTIPEAQAMGVITVGTSHGGACETIRHGITGFLTPPGDAAALAHALDDILELPETAAAAIRDASIASVRENFSTEKMCAATLAVYRDLSGNSATRPTDE